MWCPEGYVTLNEIISQFLWDSDQIEPAPDAPPGFRTNAQGPREEEVNGWMNWLIVAFIYVCGDDVRACLPSGSIVRLTPEAFSWDGGYEYWWGEVGGPAYDRSIFPDIYGARVWLSGIEFFHINIGDGTIKNGDSDDFRGYVPITGAALCISEANLPVRLEDLTGWIIEEVKKVQFPQDIGTARQHTSRTIPDEIVHAFKTNKVRTKPEAKRMFGRGIKHEAWQALWREACEIMPALSRPGPRASSNSGSYSE